ncbi:MAG TPA: DNA/RNA non-specific endonuclease [Longimicrobium sp.]|uniref:DNA/RNA non-specific endonuclease n=1 Tax=Longimicrobium sp. TaxID=2029185 RepID=UPI002EDB0AB9
MMVSRIAKRTRGALGLVAMAVLAACSTDSPTLTAPSDKPSLYTYPSAIYRSHTEFGAPIGSWSSDVRLSKNTHSISYNCARGGPNWVSWNLNKTHFGDAARSTSFYSDGTLPTGCYRVTTSDYTNSGYSRGHMVRSEERTWSSDHNRQTFLMTNILPQYQDLNGGPWYKFEQYLQTQAQTYDKEIYIVAGGYSYSGTLLGAGKVGIATRNYKIALLMPYGQGLAQATSTGSLQVIAVDMPNTTGIASNSWETYRTTVDAIESRTGTNFLPSLRDDIEAYWEAR